MEIENKFLREKGSLAVHIPPIANLQHQDAQCSILDIGDDAVVTDAVFPEFTQRRATGLSSLASSFRAASSNSIRQTKMALHIFNGVRLRATGAHIH